MTKCIIDGDKMKKRKRKTETLAENIKNEKKNNELFLNI